MKNFTEIMFTIIILIINFINLTAQNTYYKDYSLDKNRIQKINKGKSIKVDTLILYDTIINAKVKVDIEIPMNGNYLYAFPPYPIPAKQIVSSLIVWDTKLDINNAEMSVYDINGNKVCGKEKIILNQQTDYYGVVTWNVNTIIKGIYFIQIKHGTAAILIKVMIE